MTEAETKTKQIWRKVTWRKVWKYLLLLTVVALLLLAAGAWYMTTPSFQAFVRRHIVAELERTTGGRVELGSFHTVPFHFQVEVRDVTIHGREAASEVPYAHVDSLVARVKIISLLSAEFGFHSVVLDHPVIHVIFYPDGTTNVPEPGVRPASGATPTQTLFSLSINRLEVRRGQLLWDDQNIPLDFVATGVSADMTRSLLRGRYESNLLLTKVDTKFKDFRPISWTAEAHFTLGKNTIEVKSLKATSGKSRIEASGNVVNLRQPKIEANYDLTLDLGEAAATARQPQVQRGVLQAKGKGSWSLDDFSSAGNLEIKDLDWRDPSIALKGAAMSSKFSITPLHALLSDMQLRLLGGSITGDADITGWLSPDTTQLAPKTKPAEQKGLVRLRVKGLSSSEIAAAIFTPARVLNRLNWAGNTNGTVEARWTGAPRNAEVSVALDVAPPASLKPGQIPLTAHAGGTYRAVRKELQVDDFSASTRATQIRATGTLSSAAALRLSINTTDLGEWQPVAGALWKAQHMPVILHGHATFTGTATGKLPDVTVAGNLVVENFDSLIPATVSAPEKQVHWDVLSANLQLSGHAFSVNRGLMHHADTDIRFAFRTALDHGQFSDSSPLEAKLDVRNGNIAEIVGLAGYDYPVSGKLDANLQAAGTWTKPSGGGKVRLTDAVIYGEPVEAFNSDVQFVDGEVQASNIQLTHYDAKATGSLSWNLNSKTFRFDLAGTNVDLARISQLQKSRFAVAGRMDFTAQGSGTLDQPSLNASLHLSELVLNHQPTGGFTIEAATSNGELRLTGKSQFERALLAIDGKAQMHGDWPSTIALHFDHMDVNPILRAYVQENATGPSSLNGDLQLEGPLRRPREMTITGTLNDLQAEIENIKVHNQDPVHFSVSNRYLEIEQFHLVGGDTDLAVTGTVQLTGERDLDLRAKGQFNLQLIQSFSQDFTSSGVVSVDMTLAGTVSRPIPQGQLKIAGGYLGYNDLPSALSDINGSMTFNQERLQIDTLTAKSGSGIVTFGGFATVSNKQINFDIDVQGQSVRLRYPPGISSTADAQLHFVGNSNASLLTGDVTVTKLAMTPGFDFGAYLARSTSQSNLSTASPILSRIRLDIHVGTTPELQMQTASVRLSGDADLRIRGTAAKTVILGRADVIEGQVYFNGTKYNLERGDVTFVNPVTTTPQLDLQATTRIRDYDITLNLNGATDKLNITYRSEPPLPSADIIALLALGRTREESAQLQQSGQSSLGQDASNLILSEALNATVSNRVQRLFGVSRIKIDPQGMNSETSTAARGPQVTIEQQVSDSLTLSYSQNVSQASQQIIQIQYNISSNVSIVGLRDQNGVVSFDLIIRQRKK